MIVSDYRLRGDENGIAAIAALQAAAGRSIAACLMSGDTDHTLIALARDAGLTLLHKPVRPAKLRSLLRSLTATPVAAQVPPGVVPAMSSPPLSSLLSPPMSPPMPPPMPPPMSSPECTPQGPHLDASGPAVNHRIAA